MVMHCQTAKELKFNSFSRLGTITHFTRHIRTRREIGLEHGLASTSHISQDSLPKVPPQKLIHWSIGFIEKLLIKMCSSNAF